MQFIKDVLKNMKNPFIVEDEFGISTMKWLDNWTENGTGYQFKCEVDAEGNLMRVSKSDFHQTDSRHAYYLWAPKRTDWSEGQKPSIDTIIYQEHYKSWEDQLKIKYRMLGITEEDVRHQFEKDQKICRARSANNKNIHVASVYLIHMIGTDFYKIGLAKDASERVKQLQTGNPAPLRLVFEARTLDAYAAESEIHGLFNDCQVQNEWFELPEPQLNEVLCKLRTFRLCS